MPELPEVESIRRSLEEFFPAGPVLGCQVAYDSLIDQPKGSGEGFCQGVLGQEIASVDRRGKYLVFPFLAGGGMIVHLGMTGKIYKKSLSDPPGPYTHIRWDFHDRSLHYEDVRRFGRIYVCQDQLYDQPPLAKLGPEPLSPDWTGEVLHQALRGRKAPIKSLLLSQRLVAGLGNIYADEALFQAGIRPGKAGGRLTRPQCQRLVAAIKAIIQEAIDYGGSSIRDYRNADGTAGSFQESHQVYGRAGQACPICQKPLSKTVIAGRTTVYCSRCQTS